MIHSINLVYKSLMVFSSPSGVYENQPDKRKVSDLPIPFPNGLLRIDRNAKPIQNVAYSFLNTVAGHRFNLAAALVKFLLQVIERANYGWHHFSPYPFEAP